MKALQFLLLSLLSFNLSFSQNFNIIKDINSSANSYPNTFSIVDSLMFFSADDGLHGRELWRTNGKQEGTYMIKDIKEDSLSSNPGKCTGSGKLVYFIAATINEGGELWSTDGTPAGTKLVKDIYPGFEPSYIDYMTDVRGTLFFSAYDQKGTKLWKTDGSLAGTVPLTVKYNGKDYTRPKNLIQYHDSLFFFAIGPNGRDAFFKISATDTAATYIKELYGPYDSYYDLRQMLVVNDILYFGGGAADSSGLWRTDGSVKGTYLVKAVSPKFLTGLNGVLYFAGSDDKHGNEVWKTNGTEQGTVLIKDISPKKLSSISNLVKCRNLIFYTYQDGVSYKQTVYKTDGTDAGTIVAFDFTNCYSLKATNDYLFFTKEIYKTGRELWKSDGTQTGTSIVSDLLPGYLGSLYSINFESLNNQMFFAGSNHDSGDELWKTDGVENPVLVKDINTRSTGNSNAYIQTVYDNKFFIEANNIDGIQPWISDGTEQGTFMLKNIIPDSSGNVHIQQAVEFKNDLYFQHYAYAGSGANRTQRLYKTNGTSAGTELAAETGNSNKTGTPAANDQYILYPYFTSAYGTELWRTDLTKKNTQLVKDIFTGALGSDCNNLFSWNNIIFFSAYNNESGFALWRSNGTSEGTYAIKSFALGSPHSFFGFKNKVYYTVGKAKQLWVTDGTEQGTRLVVEEVSGNQIKQVTNMQSSGDYLFFNGDNGITGIELWRSKVTDNKAMLVKDITNGGDSRISNLTDVNGTIYFTLTTSYDAEFRNALWKTDGTSEGTLLIKNNFYGSGKDFYVSSLINVNGKLAFLTYPYKASPYQYELWQSNGTYTGTQKIYDDNFSGLSFYSPDLHTLNGKLYFIASTYRYGTEIWGGYLPAITTLITQNNGSMP